jgi:endonuclease G, mitochondrial
MSSVFEKLEVSINPPAEETIIRRLEQSGYDENFLGVPVGLPILGASQSDAFIRNGSEIVRYTHFSLALSKSRRFAIWVAWNIDGSSMKKVSRKGIPFVIDPNIPAKYQADDSLYSGNRLDRGHIARRADLCWGAMAEAKKANIDSFFFTNITPQMDDFNQSSKAGIWGKLEDAVFSDVDVQNLRVSVFGGPVFQEDDRLFRGIRVPREFFKVIVFVERGELRARGFLLTQNLNQLEALELDEFRVYQVALSEVEARCKFAFPEVLRGADALGARLARRPETLIERPALESVSEIEW